MNPTDTQTESAQSEIPNWKISKLENGGEVWVARSPTFREDGIAIYARSASELVDRVRSLVRALALAMDRAGKLDATNLLAGAMITRANGHTHTHAPTHEAPPEKAPDGPVKATRPQYDQHTGEQCAECYSSRLRRSGTCMVCMDCGTTTGCS